MSVKAPTFKTARLLAIFSRASHEPLLQFIAAALLLFSANSLIHGGEQRTGGAVITIPEGRVRQIAESYRLLSGRLPSRAELQSLVADFVLEEVYYRDAVAMGLDADDVIVRRRMRQKLEFLIEDADASEEPSDIDLAARLASHAAEYRLPERLSFRQVLASGDARGGEAYADADAFLAALKSGADPEKLGDATMLPAVLPLTTAQGAARVFGDAFALSAFAYEGKGWFGPIVSPFGAHVVLIVSREAARDPTLDEVRDKLRSDWIEARRIAKRENFEARLRERYDVRIEWPAAYAGDAGGE